MDTARAKQPTTSAARPGPGPAARSATPMDLAPSAAQDLSAPQPNSAYRKRTRPPAPSALPTRLTLEAAETASGLQLSGSAAEARLCGRAMGHIVEVAPAVHQTAPATADTSAGFAVPMDRGPAAAETAAAQEPEAPAGAPAGAPTAGQPAAQLARGTGPETVVADARGALQPEFPSGSAAGSALEAPAIAPAPGPHASAALPDSKSTRWNKQHRDKLMELFVECRDEHGDYEVSKIYDRWRVLYPDVPRTAKNISDFKYTHFKKAKTGKSANLCFACVCFRANLVMD